MKDFALLLLRLTIGGLMAGHGAQKLFGWFGGYGMKGTGGWLESIGLRPGERWAMAAGLSEFGGGMLTTLGLFNPLGPLSVMGSMGMATAKVHWGKPIWVTEGGPELPLVNSTVCLALIAAGPGRYSLDRAFGVRVPAWVAGLVAALAAAVLITGVQSEPAPRPGVEKEAGAELQSGVS